MAPHSRYAVTVSAAVATRSRADCSSMEDRGVNLYITSEEITGHTSLSTALFNLVANDTHLRYHHSMNH